MKAILINNDTKHLKEIEKMLVKLKIKYDIFREYEIPKDVKRYDFAILSGGGSPGIVKKPEKFADEIKLLKKIPTIGICLGFEVIAYTFGCKIDGWDKRRTGSDNIQFIDEKGKLIKRVDVHVAHKHYVKLSDKNLIKNFYIPAKRTYYPEIIIHKKYPVAGTQFHPEMSGKNGLNIFKELLNNILKKSKTSLKNEVRYLRKHQRCVVGF